MRQFLINLFLVTFFINNYHDFGVNFHWKYFIQFNNDSDRHIFIIITTHKIKQMMHCYSTIVKLDIHLIIRSIMAEIQTQYNKWIIAYRIDIHYSKFYVRWHVIHLTLCITVCLVFAQFIMLEDKTRACISIKTEIFKFTTN